MKTTTVFYEDPRVLRRNAGYGVALVVGAALLFAFRAPVAAELATPMSTFPFLGEAGAARILEWVLVLLFVVAGPLFVVSVLFMIRRLRDPTPALVVEPDGFLDQASLAALGRVDWREVDRLELVEHLQVPQLRVHLADPDRVLDRLEGARGAWVRVSHRFMRAHGSIPLHDLQGEPEDVLRAVERCSGRPVAGRP